MQRTTNARNAIGPLLDQLIWQLEHEGRSTQCAYFNRIRNSLNTAQHELELVTPIQELSTTPAVGFQFSQDADALIVRILEKAAELGSIYDEFTQHRQ